MINSIKGNTISEADTKKKLNELNEIKKVEIKGKRLIENQKKLLSLFDDLKTIFNENVNESNSNTKNVKVIMKVSMKVIIKAKMRVKKINITTRQLNNLLETIDQTKSLEEQIKLLKEKGEFLAEYWYVKYYHDNKELNYKIFKAKATHLLTDLDE